MAGFGARTSQELSLHIHEPRKARKMHKTDFDFEESDSECQRRRLLFCCVYDLDSWSSFMTGLPRILSFQLPPDYLDYLVRRQPFIVVT